MVETAEVGPRVLAEPQIVIYEMLSMMTLTVVFAWKMKLWILRGVYR